MVKRGPLKAFNVGDKAKEWFWLGVVFVVALVVILSLAVMGVVVFQLRSNNAVIRTDVEAHNLTLAQIQAQVKQDRTLLREIQATAQEDHLVISKLPAADAYLGAVAINLNEQIALLNSKMSILCASISHNSTCMAPLPPSPVTAPAPAHPAPAPVHPAHPAPAPAHPSHATSPAPTPPAATPAPPRAPPAPAPAHGHGKGHNKG